MARRWSVQVFAQDGVPEELKLLAFSLIDTPPERVVWHCPFWRRGAPIFFVGR